VTAGPLLLSIEPAIKRANRLHERIRKLLDEMVKVPSPAEMYADSLIADFYYRDSDRSAVGVTPGLEDVGRLKRAYDNARRELPRMREVTPGSLPEWQRSAFHAWIMELSGVLKRRGLPSGPGVTETKDEVRYSAFGKPLRALQTYAVPPDIRRSMTGEAMEKAIKRALRKRKVGTGIT
jgi:hypothetical protein